MGFFPDTNGMIQALLDSPNMSWRRPVIDDRLESNIPGLYIAGDLAGAPVVKLAMEQGHRVANLLISEIKGRKELEAEFDVAIIGAGASGLNAALTVQQAGLRVVVLEKREIASTFADFPEGKWIYAEPVSRPAVGPLWLEECTKEEILERWNAQVREAGLDVRTGESVTAIERRRDSTFVLKTERLSIHAKRVILASGQRGNPRWLGAAGEDTAGVMHRLYSPKHYENEDIVVVGGGNSAIEAALALCDRNRVTLVHRGPDFARVFRKNAKELDAAQRSGKIQTFLNAKVTTFASGEVTLTYGPKVERTLPCDHVFVLIGAELPSDFLKSLGIKLENEWTGNPWEALAGVALTLGALSLAVKWLALLPLGWLLWRGFQGSRWAWLAVSFLVSYTIYGVKFAPGQEFWPYGGWGYKFFSFFDRPWSFWYTILYTAVMTIFGFQAMRRWGLSRGDKFQIWRFSSLIGFQWLFFFLVPEYLFQWAVKYQWVGAELAKDPNFANNAWRSYGLVYAWPLFFYTFFSNPHQVWIVWGALLSFGLIPILVLFHGKRYCSWICGCGGLAETLGDRWRHLAPKGPGAIAWERMNSYVFGFAIVVTVCMLGKDVWSALTTPAEKGILIYRIVADTWLVGILPVTLYPFFGGKVWCRYWCPLAKMMELWSVLFTRFKASRFAIVSNEKCITCGECTRNCQVGIDVMNFAMKQEELNNANSSCIGCGICVTVCPMDVLSFAPRVGMPAPEAKLVQISNL